MGVYARVEIAMVRYCTHTQFFCQQNTIDEGCNRNGTVRL